jgi:hypothetical protein
MVYHNYEVSSPFMLCLEVWRERRVEGRGMIIHSPCLDVLKIK